MKDYTVTVTFTDKVLAYNKTDAINLMQYLIDHKEATAQWTVELVKKPKKQIKKKKNNGKNK